MSFQSLPVSPWAVSGAQVTLQITARAINFSTLHTSNGKTANSKKLQITKNSNQLFHSSHLQYSKLKYLFAINWKLNRKGKYERIKWFCPEREGVLSWSWFLQFRCLHKSWFGTLCYYMSRPVRHLRLLLYMWISHNSFNIFKLHKISSKLEICYQFPSSYC